MSKRIACQVREGCPYAAYAQIQIVGTHQRPPVNMCRIHSAVMIHTYTQISNDIRVRNAR